MFVQILKMFFFIMLLLTIAYIVSYLYIDEKSVFIELKIAKSCFKSNFQYDDPIATSYLSKNAHKLKDKFDKCRLNESNIDQFNRFLIISDISTSETEDFEIKLDANKLTDVYKLTSTPICSIQRFQKKMNCSEKNKKLIYSNLNRFNSNNNFRLRLNTSGFYFLSCLNNSSKTTIFEDVFTILPYNMSANKRHKPFKNSALFSMDLNFEKCESDESNQKESNKIKMNVLLIGLDSVSSHHMRRVFPLTYEFLNRNGVCFTNFNKVGENTFPNHLALFCGMTAEHTQEEFGIKNTELQALRNLDGKFFDNYPFIWREYERTGYVSMFQEDLPLIGMFNYLKGNYNLMKIKYKNIKTILT